MMQAKKIITDALQTASNAQARQRLDTFDETFSIVAAMHRKIFTAYQREGFNDEEAMYLLTIHIEGQQQ